MNYGKVLEIRNVVKEYPTPAGSVRALSGISFFAGKAELIAIMGESGSGKSTLLNLITGIDTPDSGDVFINGENMLLLFERTIVIAGEEKTSVSFFSFFN